MTETTTSTSGRLARDVIRAANGFDEIAVAKHFDGLYLYDEHNQNIRVARAAVFLHRRSVGDSDPAAYQHAMTMPVSALEDYFEDEPEVDDDEDAEGNG